MEVREQIKGWGDRGRADGTRNEVDGWETSALELGLRLELSHLTKSQSTYHLTEPVSRCVSECLCVFVCVITSDVCERANN